MGYLFVYSIYYFCFITTLTLSSIDLSLFVKSIVKKSFSSVELFFFKKQLLGTIGLTKRRPRKQILLLVRTFFCKTYCWKEFFPSSSLTFSQYLKKNSKRTRFLARRKLWPLNFLSKFSPIASTYIIVNYKFYVESLWRSYFLFCFEFRVGPWFCSLKNHFRLFFTN